MHLFKDFSVSGNSQAHRVREGQELAAVQTKRNFCFSVSCLLPMQLCAWKDRAVKRLRMPHFRPSRPISFEIAQSARHLARKYRLEQHVSNETLDFAVKFRLVLRYETVVFRRYVLALLLVGLLRKFEAYLVYLTLI